MSSGLAERWRRSELSVLCALCALAAVGCADLPESRVTFGSAKGPIGKWVFPSDAGETAELDAARDAAVAVDSEGPTQRAADAAETDAGSDVQPDAGAPDKPISALAFEVTTQPIGGKYAPKNVGAIWIGDASGKLVKSLEVWAATRMRYLTEYNKMRASMSVDAASRATLPKHRAHQVVWDLKDRNGAVVPRGPYKLNLELTDTDSTGKTVSIDFDTSEPASMRTPPDAACFTQMKLELK